MFWWLIVMYSEPTLMSICESDVAPHWGLFRTKCSPDCVDWDIHGGWIVTCLRGIQISYNSWMISRKPKYMMVTQRPSESTILATTAKDQTKNERHVKSPFSGLEGSTLSVYVWYLHDIMRICIYDQRFCNNYDLIFRLNYPKERTWSKQVLTFINYA